MTLLDVLDKCKKVSNYDLAIKQNQENLLILADILKQVNPQEMFSRLNINITDYGEGERDYYIGYCPDHHLRIGSLPSAPKWLINKETGICKCLTEDHSSSLLDVVKNLYKVNNKKAFDLIRGNVALKNPFELKLQNYLIKPEIKQIQEATIHSNASLNAMAKKLDEGYLSEKGYNYFKKYGIDKNIVNLYGIIEYGYSRIIIPFHNLSGELCGYVSIDKLGKKESIRNNYKQYFYKNPEVKLSLREKKSLIKTLKENYKKAVFCVNAPLSKNFFGLFQVLQSKKDVKSIILVEGEKDVLKLQQEGFWAIGCHGAHLTKQQLNVLKTLNLNEIAIAFDGDRAGREAAEKILPKLTTVCKKVYNVKIEDGKDPKDYNQTEFKLLLNNTLSEGINNGTIITNNTTNTNGISKFITEYRT